MNDLTFHPSDTDLALLTHNLHVVASLQQGDKLTVDFEGRLQVQPHTLLRPLMRRMWRDGVSASVSALESACVSLVSCVALGICMDTELVRESRHGLHRLQATYLSDGETLHAPCIRALSRMCMVMGFAEKCMRTSSHEPLTLCSETAVSEVFADVADADAGADADADAGADADADAGADAEADADAAADADADADADAGADADAEAEADAEADADALRGNAYAPAPQRFWPSATMVFTESFGNFHQEMFLPDFVDINRFLHCR